MGSKAADVWKFLVPVSPCGSSRAVYSRSGLLRSQLAVTAKGSSTNPTLDVVIPKLEQLRSEISAVGARVSYVEEQVELVKAALPELDSQIRYARLGMPRTSRSLEEIEKLHRIHWKMLHFWQGLSRMQLEKLAGLAECLQNLEEHRAVATNKIGVAGGEEGDHPNTGSEDFYKKFEQRVCEKVVSDLRENQELDTKLYLNRISSVPENTKSTATLSQPPPERGMDEWDSLHYAGKSRRNRVFIFHWRSRRTCLAIWSDAQPLHLWLCFHPRAERRRVEELGRSSRSEEPTSLPSDESVTSR